MGELEVGHKPRLVRCRLLLVISSLGSNARCNVIYASRYLSVPFTQQDLTQRHFYCGDLIEGLGYEPRLVRSRTMLVIGSLGTMRSVLAFVKSPGTKVYALDSRAMWIYACHCFPPGTVLLGHLRNLSDTPPCKNMAQGRFMVEVTHESRLMCVRCKNSWPRWHSPFGMP